MTNQAMKHLDKVRTKCGKLGLLILWELEKEEKVDAGLDVEVFVRLQDGLEHIFSYKDLELVCSAPPASEPDLRVWVEYSHDDMTQMI